ncbi:TRAP transporter large permease [bacterium]|nr:TRAP transporter large permease [candidate division CSSED10-310 bacterium]
MGLVTVILALLGTPLFVIIAANTFMHLYLAGFDFSLTSIEFYRISGMPMLLPIPLFTFAGYILAESGAPKRLLKLSQAALGWMPGGLAVVCITACALFTAFTGASGVTIIALGGLLFPALIQEKYGETFSLGLITTSGSLGLLFPPSLPLILYGVVAGVSIDDLFLAGIFPGLIMVTLLAAYSSITAVRKGVARPAFSRSQIAKALWEARYEIPLPFLILFGIYSGKFAISEAAALTAFAVLFVEMVLYHEIEWRNLPVIMRKSMVLVGSILIIMGCAMGYTNILLDAEVPVRILDAIKVHMHSRLAFLIALNVFLLIVGCMLDIFSALIVVIPLIVPIARSYDVNLVHLGIIFLANLNIGYMTPPVGLNLFISSIRFKKPVITLYWATIPFLVIMFISLILITYIPGLSLFLLK